MHKQDLKIQHLSPIYRQKLLADWLLKLRRENTPVANNMYVCSEHIYQEWFIKPLGGQRMHLKQGSVSKKVVFTIEKPKRTKPCYTRTSKTHTQTITATDRIENVFC